MEPACTCVPEQDGGHLPAARAGLALLARPSWCIAPEECGWMPVSLVGAPHVPEGTRCFRISSSAQHDSVHGPAKPGGWPALVQPQVSTVGEAVWSVVLCLKLSTRGTGHTGHALVKATQICSKSREAGLLCARSGEPALPHHLRQLCKQGPFQGKHLGPGPSFQSSLIPQSSCKCWQGLLGSQHLRRGNSPP